MHNSYVIDRWTWLVWRSSNDVRRINEVITSSPVSTGIGDDLWRVYQPGIYPGHSGPLSQVIPPWVGAMITVDGFDHLWEQTVPLKLQPGGAL